MKVIYLNHSGFLLEWNSCYWLFDYFKGTVPPLDPAKDIVVFCSHSHEDHFNPDVFDLLDIYPSVTFVFSSELRKKCKKYDYDIHFLEDRTDTSLTLPSGEMLQIHTLKSTDCGCAFIVTYENKNIYHAGDLHWWYWEGEDSSWNEAMTADYKSEMKYFEGFHLDLAFTPLDPRQEKDYALGINYLLAIADVTHLFPMHFWDDFSIIRQYEAEHLLPPKTFLHTLQFDGQMFELML